jgi:hypothetical protein
MLLLLALAQIVASTNGTLDLIQRVSPTLAPYISLEIINSETPFSKVSTNATHINLEGESQLSLAVAFNTYLKAIN